MSGIRHALRRHLLLAAPAVLFTAACAATDIVSDHPGGAVVTVVDSSAALHTARTFVIPDTVITLTLTTAALRPGLAHELVAQVRAHFVALGWTELRDTVGSHPDVLVLLAASSRIQSGVAYPDWFSSWGYLPYWNAGVDQSWIWSAPNGDDDFVYQVGTLLVTMIDVRVQRTDSRSIPLLWAAVLDGVVGGGTTIARVQNGIDQAFEQSPYLRVN